MKLQILFLINLLFYSNNNLIFTKIENGLEYTKIELSKYSEYNGYLHIIKIDPNYFKPEVYLSKELNEKPMTASNWCKKYSLNVCINPGMYHKDFSTHVGYLKHNDYINNNSWNNYKSALLINPIGKNYPFATIIDLDNPTEKELTNRYNTIVQNLRLIKGDRVNVWKKTERNWSEAALGMDKNNKIFIFFTDTEMNMFDFNEVILKLPLNIIKAFHTDGGPPASLSVSYKDFTLNLSGNTISGEQEPIPNILGFRIVSK